MEKIVNDTMYMRQIIYIQVLSVILRTSIYEYVLRIEFDTCDVYVHTNCLY